MPNEIAVLREVLRSRESDYRHLCHWVDDVQCERDALEFRCVLLTEALRRARDDMEGWGGYASPYFQEKWGLSDDLKAINDVLAGV